MKRFSEQFKKQATSIRLSAAEKRDLEERLTAYMEYHPLPKDMAPMVSSRASLASEPFVLWKVDWSKLLGVAGTTMVLLFIMVPVVAERAVPGDVLYPVKVKFNEEVRSSLTLSPYEKVAWETERLERRIAEARLLASEGKLTEEMQSEVAEAVKKHSDAAQKEIASLAISDSDEAAIAGIAFSTALEVQSEVLSRESEVGEGENSIAKAVSEARATQVVPDELPSVPKLLARIEIETTTATEYFASLEDVATAEEAKDIERRLSDIAKKVADAQAVLAAPTETTEAATTLAAKAVADPEDTAASILRQALMDTRKLISFMTDLDVKKNLTIEELVPVTLTPEERLERSVALAQETETVRTTVLATLTGVRDAALRERITGGLTAVGETLTLASSTRALETAADSERYASEALAMSKDLLLALNAAGYEAGLLTGTTTTASTTPETTTATSTATSSDVLLEGDSEERSTSSVVDEASA